MKDNKQLEEIVRIVRDSLKESPELNEMKIEIDVEHVHSTDMRGKYWWKVPIVPRPWPKRQSLFYEIIIELEEMILEKYNLDVSLYLGAAEPISAERELASSAP